MSEKLDEYHVHEVIHTSHIIIEMIEAQLCKHPAIRQTPALAKLAQEAADAVGRLYMTIPNELWEPYGLDNPSR